MLWEDKTTVQKYLHMVKLSGKCNGFSVSHQEALDATRKELNKAFYYIQEHNIELLEALARS